MEQNRDIILEQLQKDLAEIKVALLGNRYISKGALWQISANDERIGCIEKKIDKAVWTAIGAGTGAGFIISILWKLLIG